MPALAFAALLLLASAPVQAPAGAPVSPHPLSPSGAGSHPASMGFSGGQPLLGPASAVDPNYDEQMGVTFGQDLTSLAYNITALAQVDANGFGPAYLINGLSSAGYWYQVGISYHWPSSNGVYSPTFGFSYEVFSPGGKSVFPGNGGAGLTGLSKAVHSGDMVQLSITFSGSTVQMLAQDWNTGATAKVSFSSEGSSRFVGSTASPTDSQGFFTGLMTEWYHVAPYSGNIGKVSYTNQAVAISSAWMWLDEFDITNPSPPLFVNQTMGPVAFANEEQIYPFASHGVTMYSSARQFIMGLLNSASSRVTLGDATAETAVPSFAATYTLAGLPQSAPVDPETPTIVEADPGTSVTLSFNSTDPARTESWVFGGSGNSAVTSVTFAAGTNVTYVYYHLFRETVSYQLVGGGSLPASASPQLVYFVPPATPSGTRSPVRATQTLRTTPVEVLAIQGTTATFAGPIPGAPGESWQAGGQAWSVFAPDTIPNPIRLYHEYQVSAAYSLIGGGTPPNAPELTFSFLGTPTTSQMSVGQTTYWLDAGSAYNCTSVLYGSSPAERWSGGGSGVVSGNAMIKGVVDQVVASVIIANYTHQYLAFLGANDADGGSVAYQAGSGGKATDVDGPSSGVAFQVPVWLDAGSAPSLSASPKQGWEFESWKGSGPGAYSGTDPAIGVKLSGPVNESAIFYVQLAISADAKTSVAYSSPPAAGTVQPGSTKVVYLPPFANVSLVATPSLFAYSFASWRGTGIQNATHPSLSLVVGSPSQVTGASSYNYPALLGIGTVAVVAALAVSLWARARRRKGGFGPAPTI